MTAIGLLNDEVRKKYDSTSLHPKINNHKEIDAIRAVLPRLGYEAVKVCEAMYFRDFPRTRSPNMRPEGMMLNATVTTTEMKNWAIPIMSGMLPWSFRSSTRAM